MDQLREIVLSSIKTLDEQFVATVCGSYRRGEWAWSGRVFVTGNDRVLLKW